MALKVMVATGWSQRYPSERNEWDGKDELEEEGLEPKKPKVSWKVLKGRSQLTGEVVVFVCLLRLPLRGGDE